MEPAAGAMAPATARNATSRFAALPELASLLPAARIEAVFELSLGLLTSSLPSSPTSSITNSAAREQGRSERNLCSMHSRMLLRFFSFLTSSEAYSNIMRFMQSCWGLSAFDRAAKMLPITHTCMMLSLLLLLLWLRTAPCHHPVALM
jgi:hypothetical protein